MRYWLNALLGVVICSAAAVAVSFATWALTRSSTCSPGAGTLACRWESVPLAGAIVVALLVVIPLGSQLFKHRTAPTSGGLGLLAVGLALTGGAGAALSSGVTVGTGEPEATAAGIVVGVVLLLGGPFLLLVGIAVAMRGPAQGTLVVRAPGHAKRAAAAEAAKPAPPQTVALGALAAQLSQIAAARERVGGDALAARLRQLDDLRAAGVLNAEEHAAKRREVLNEM